MTFTDYIAYCRRPGPLSDSTDRWYRFSDAEVDSSSIREALSANPFMLFYERFHLPSLSPPDANPPTTTNSETEPQPSVRLSSPPPMARLVQRWSSLPTPKLGLKSSSVGVTAE